MSKSLGPRHYIGLFEEEDSIRKKIRSAVTDSGVAPPGGDEEAGEGDGRTASPGIENLLTLLAACGHEADAGRMREDYFAGTLRYVNLKGQTADALVALTTEMRERRPTSSVARPISRAGSWRWGNGRGPWRGRPWRWPASGWGPSRPPSDPRGRPLSPTQGELPSTSAE